MKDKQHIDALLKRFRNGTITKEEYQELMGYLDNPKYEPWIKESMEAHWSSIDEKASQTLQEEPASYELLGRIREKMDGLDGDRKWDNTKISNKWYGIAAAIAVLVATGITYFGKTSPNAPTLITQRMASGQKGNLTLPDGTKVNLNSDSKLVFPESFAGDTREVVLEGEAFFEVKRNEEKPFLVRTGNLTTKVLGTSFNIKAYGDDKQIAVSVATGKVEVTEQRNASADNGVEAVAKILLTPNEQVVYNEEDRSLTKKEVTAGSIAAWKDGVLFFERTPFGEVVQTLERWYGVNIELENPDLDNCLIRGKHEKQNLSTVLQALQFSMDITYEINEKGSITINGKGCPEVE